MSDGHPGLYIWSPGTPDWNLWSSGWRMIMCSHRCLINGPGLGVWSHTPSILCCMRVHGDIKSSKNAWLMFLGRDGNMRLLTSETMEVSCRATGTVPAGVPWAAGPSPLAELSRAESCGQSWKFPQVRRSEADNFGGGPRTFCWFFFNLMFTDPPTPWPALQDSSTLIWGTFWQAWGTLVEFLHQYEQRY